MGKTKIIPLIIRESRTGKYIAPWHIKSAANVHGLGQPTTEKLSEWRNQFNQSLLKGGCNEHIGINGWLQCSLEVYNQITKQIVCKYSAPMFELIP